MGVDGVEQVRGWVREAQRGPGHWGVLEHLVQLASEESSADDERFAALQGAESVFRQCAARLSFVDAPSATADSALGVQAENEAASWLHDLHRRFVDACVSGLGSESDELRLLSLRVAFSALRGYAPISERPRARRSFPIQDLSALYRQLLTLSEPALRSLVQRLEEKYWPRADLRYHSMVALRRPLADWAQTDDSIRSAALYDLLRRLGVPRTQNELSSRHAPSPVDQPFVWVEAANSAATASNPSSKRSRKQVRNDERTNDPHLSMRCQRQAYAAMWKAYLGGRLPAAIYRQVLMESRELLLENFPKPIELMDFLMSAYQCGGVVGLLALEGVFTLITKHNLDFPDFFDHLYKLLVPDVFFVAHRNKLFTLLNRVLRTSFIPEHVVAAYIKRLARLCLSAPPAGILVALPVLYNLLRRHPACRSMIARPTQDLGKLLLLNRPAASNAPSTAEPEEPSKRAPKKKKRGTAQEPAATELLRAWDQAERSKVASSEGLDPFDMLAETPLTAHASHSSLWELHTLQCHYHPAVARMARSFFETVKQADIDLADFLDQSYASMIRTELKRRVPSIPTAFAAPETLFDNDPLFSL